MRSAFTAVQRWPRLKRPQTIEFLSNCRAQQSGRCQKHLLAAALREAL
jgi:hypothetical protein